jgi:hypothetical protein
VNNGLVSMGSADRVRDSVAVTGQSKSRTWGSFDIISLMVCWLVQQWFLAYITQRRSQGGPRSKREIVQKRTFRDRARLRQRLGLAVVPRRGTPTSIAIKVGHPLIMLRGFFLLCIPRCGRAAARSLRRIYKLSHVMVSCMYSETLKSEPRHMICRR